MTPHTDNMLAPLAHALRATHKDKIVSAADAVLLIHEGDTVATGGFVGIGFANPSPWHWRSASRPRKRRAI